MTQDSEEPQRSPVRRLRLGTEMERIAEQLRALARTQDELRPS